MSITISQSSFDELQEVLNVTVDEYNYNRWIQNGRIRLEDIWDVLTNAPMMTIVDWRSGEDEIKEYLLQIFEANNREMVLDEKISDINELHNWIKQFNNKSNEIEIILFGKDWNESDSVQILALEKSKVERIFKNNELESIFSKI
jgi:hypothetical protein